MNKVEILEYQIEIGKSLSGAAPLNYVINKLVQQYIWSSISYQDFN